MFAGPPVSTSMDFDESVFGPLHRHHTSSRKDARRGQGRESALHSLANQTNSHNMTQYNESILAPIQNANKRVSREPKARGSDESILVPARNELLAEGKVDEGVLAPIGAPRKGFSCELTGHGDGNESILAPIRNARKGISHEPFLPREPLSQGEDNESILAPVRDARKKKEICGDPNGGTCSAQGPVVTRRTSAFEMMMASLEKSSGDEGKGEMLNG